MATIESLKEYQNSTIDEVLATIKFKVSGGGAPEVESDPLDILKTAVRVHFFRYGLFQKNPRQGKAPLVIYAPEEQAEHNCDLSYKEPYIFEQIHLDAAVIKAELHPPQGAVALENYSYQRTTIKDGYIYIFDEDNRDWHTEYEVSHFGNLTNITWDDPQNKNSDGTYKDTRIPVNRDLKRSTTYHVVPKKGTKIRVCFSPVQWSADYHNKVRTSEQLRSEKMLLVDCTGIPKNSKNTLVDVQSCKDVLAHFEYDQNTEAMWLQQKLKEITDDEKQQKDDLYEDMFVTLHDPWRCADTICEGIDNEITYLKAIMVSLQTGKSPDAIFSYLQNNEQVPIENTKKYKQTQYLHRLAQLTYDFVYNDHENTKKYNSSLIKSAAANVALDLTIGEYLRPFIEKNGVEKSKLEKLLAVTERKKQRDSINTYRDDLGNFMKSDYYQDIVEDYLNSIADNIEDAKERVAIHKIALGNYPNMHDRHLDLKAAYQLHKDTWYTYINETLYNETPQVFTKTTRLLDYKIDIQDIKVLSLVKKTASTMDKIIKAYTNHDVYIGSSLALREKTLPILGKISYFRDKKTRVTTFKFKIKDDFDKYIQKYNLRLEIEGKSVSLQQFKNHWNIEYKKMTKQSVEELIANKKVKVDLKTNMPYRFKAEAEKFLKSNALGSVVVMLEAYIWAKATKKWLKEDSYQADEKLIFASIKLGAATISLVEKMNLYDKHLLGKGLEEEVVEARIKKFKTRVGVLKIASSAITVFTTGRDAYISFSARDTDASVIYGMATGIGAVFLAADVSALIGGGVAYFALGFWPAALLGGALIGCYYLVQKYFADTQLEAYFKNFPLSDLAMLPTQGELPYQYSNRLVTNSTKTVVDPWFETIETKEYKSFSNFEKAYVSFLDMVVPTMVIVEPARSEHIQYRKGFDKYDTVTNRFNAYIYSAQKIKCREDIEIHAWFYPYGIKAPLKEGQRFEITPIIFHFPEQESYRFREDEFLPNCIVDFGLPDQFYWDYQEYRYGEVLFTCRVRVQDEEFAPTNFNEEPRYVFGSAQVYNKKDNQQKHLTSIFTVYRYGQRTNVLDVKLLDTTKEQAMQKPKIIAKNSIKMLQSYNPKL
ncbi:toxin VasX [Aquimarina muelleri]|uniref:toxin VasX n=1 Tax=Aquimarina muelleri TaxID=279356 RepID=UPI003F684448